MNISRKQRRYRSIWTFSLSFLFLLLSYLIILILSIHKRNLETYSKNIFIDLLLSSIIGIFNVILTLLLEYTIHYELFLTKTEELSSLVYRISFKMFFNSSLNILLVSSL